MMTRLYAAFGHWTLALTLSFMPFGRKIHEELYIEIDEMYPEPESIPSPVQLKAGANLNPGFKTETLPLLATVTLLLLCWQLHIRQVASVVETVRALDLELRNHCGENKMDKDKDEIDKRQISASFLEVG